MCVCVYVCVCVCVYVCVCVCVHVCVCLCVVLVGVRLLKTINVKTRNFVFIISGVTKGTSTRHPI